MFRLVCPRTAQGARSAGPGWSVPEELVPPRRTHVVETDAEFAATVTPRLPVVHLVWLRKLEPALTGIDFVGQALAWALGGGTGDKQQRPHRENGGDEKSDVGGVY